MGKLAQLAAIFAYSDWANERLFETALAVDDAALDTRIEMGRGSLRRTLMHIYVGERVWLARMQGNAEQPWLNEAVNDGVATIRDGWRETRDGRLAFVDGLTESRLADRLPYRDSKGGRFTATLGEMLYQCANHSVHHRAQAVNILRRVGAGLVEMDYMIWVRQPAEASSP
jgi:uncharacterized damage-inducible protein DinB